MTPTTTNNITNTNHKQLSIQVSLSGFSFCILENDTINTLTHHFFKKTIHPEELTEGLNQFFTKTPFLHQSFKKVQIIYNNNLSAFVPKNLFSDKNLHHYLKYNIKVLENDYITYDKLDDFKLVNVYIPYVNANNFFLDAFGEFTYHHFSSVLVKALLKNSKKTQEPTMYVHVQKNHFEIVVIKNQKLLFYNTFTYKTSEDFIYYILFTAEQLELHPEKFQLYFLGDVTKEDNRYKITYTYIRNISFGNHFTNYKYATSVTKPQNHSEFILLNSF